MDNNKKRFRAFENSIDAQVLVPGFNSEFNDFILSQTVVPVNKIGMHVNLDPFKTVEMLLHNYDGTPGTPETGHLMSGEKSQRQNTVQTRFNLAMKTQPTQADNNKTRLKLDNQVVSAMKRTCRITALKPQVLSTSLEATIEAIGHQFISIGAMAQDFRTFRRFPAGLLLIDIDGRNLGRKDPTPVPTVIAVFDDLTEESKAKLALSVPMLVNKTPRDRVQLYDETKLKILQKSNRLEVQHLKNDKGELILPPKSNNMKLFLRGLEFPPNEDLPWKFSFCWFDQRACQLIDDSNRFADKDWSELEKLAVWDTNKLVNDDNQPVFPPEDAVLSIEQEILDYNHVLLQEALYPLPTLIHSEPPPQSAPQATLSFRLFDPTPMEVSPYVDETNILNMLCYDKQFANHSAFTVPNPKSAQAVKNLLLSVDFKPTADTLLMKMTLLLLTAVEKETDPTELIDEFIDDFADKWTIFFVNSVLTDIDEEFLNGNMFKKLVQIQTQSELKDLVALVQRKYLKLNQTVRPADQFEAVMTVMEKLKQKTPGWASALDRLRVHVMNSYRARYCCRTGLNTLANVIFLAAHEPGKILQIYPWLASHPEVRKRIKNSSLFKRLNQDHFKALMNPSAENVLSIKMARVYQLGVAGEIPELTLYDILCPAVFDTEDTSQSEDGSRKDKNISPGDMMAISTAQQLSNLSLGTLNMGMSQFGGLPTARTLDQPSHDSFLRTLLEARETEILVKKQEDTSGFQCCFCITAAPDTRTGRVRKSVRCTERAIPFKSYCPSHLKMSLNNAKAIEAFLLDNDHSSVKRFTIMKDVIIDLKMFKSEENVRTAMQMNPLNQLMETEKIRAKQLITILGKYYRDVKANKVNPPAFPEDILTKQFGSPGCHDSWLAAYRWILHHMKSILQEVPYDWNLYLEYLQDWQRRQAFCQFLDDRDLKPRFTNSYVPEKKLKINPETGYPFHRGEHIHYNIATPTNGGNLISRRPFEITPKRNIVNNNENAYCLEVEHSAPVRWRTAVHILMTTQHNLNDFKRMNTNMDGGNRVDQDNHGPIIFTLLEASDISDQCAPEPITLSKTKDFTERVLKSVQPPQDAFQMDIDDFPPFSEDSSDDESVVSGTSTVSSADAAHPNRNRCFLSSGAKIDIGELEEACAWLTTQAKHHNKNDRARLESEDNIWFKKVFLWNEGHEVINWWDNSPVYTAKDYEFWKEKMIQKYSSPVLICEMIRLVQELERQKAKVIFHFASPIEATKFFKNHYGHCNPIPQDMARHESYKSLFEVRRPGEEPKPAKTVQELMNGTNLFFLTLQATYDGSALSHRITNDETTTARKAAVQTYVMNQLVDVMDCTLTVMTDNAILPFREGLLPLLQDNLFWSTIHATSGPTITSRGADDILPDLTKRGRILPGHRVNSIMINNKFNRALTISQIVALNRTNTLNKDHYAFCPNHRNQTKEKLEETPIIATKPSRPVKVNNDEFTTTPLSTLSISALQGFAKLERTFGTNLIEDATGLRKFPNSFYRNFQGVGAITLGNFWGLSGTAKFPYGMKMEKRDMIIAATRITNSNLAASKIEDFVPNEPSRKHPDFYGASRKWKFQHEIATYTEPKALACLVDISKGIALNNAHDYHAKFPKIKWDYHNYFMRDLNILRSDRKKGVQENTIKALGSRDRAQPWFFTQQPVSGSVPTRRELQLVAAARTTNDAPRQVGVQIDTTRRQFSLPTPAVSHTKTELVQIAAQEQQKQLTNELNYETSIVDSAKALFKAQISMGRWYDTLNSTQKERMDKELMLSATDQQVKFLATILNRETDLSYDKFVEMVLGTHWDAMNETLALNYVHVNRVMPLIDSSKRDKVLVFFQKFYNLEGVLSKMAIIESTLDMLDVEPLQAEPLDYAKYAFMEWVLARLAAFYLAPQTQPLPVPALTARTSNPSSRLQIQPREALNVVPEAVSRTSSLETLPLPSFIPRRIKLSRNPDPVDISYETEDAVMRTYRQQDERRRGQNQTPNAPGPSAGQNEDTADSSTELVFEYEQPESGSTVKK